MTRTICDRCGKDITGKEQANVRVSLYDEDGDAIEVNGAMSAGDADLCMVCAALLSETMAQLPKEAQGG